LLRKKINGGLRGLKAFRPFSADGQALFKRIGTTPVPQAPSTGHLFSRYSISGCLSWNFASPESSSARSEAEGEMAQVWASMFRKKCRFSFAFAIARLGVSASSVLSSEPRQISATSAGCGIYVPALLRSVEGISRVFGMARVSAPR
jgi:hypothetical protein